MIFKKKNMNISFSFILLVNYIGMTIKETQHYQVQHVIDHYIGKYTKCRQKNIYIYKYPHTFSLTFPFKPPGDGEGRIGGGPLLFPHWPPRPAPIVPPLMPPPPLGRWQRPWMPSCPALMDPTDGAWKSDSKAFSHRLLHIGQQKTPK